MKKIVTIFGSRNKKSRTVKYTQKLIEEISVDKEYQNIILDPTKYNLNACIGCKKCFSSGSCFLDNRKDDDGKFIKKELIESDLIIISSPVYAHNVSSDIKLMIDRLSYWLHIFKLLGKPVVILTTTDTNGEFYVNDYLTRIFEYMGAIVVKKDTFFSYDSEDEINEKIKQYRMCIIDVLSNHKKLEASATQESFFQQLKYTYLFFPAEHAEYKHWKINGYLDANSFSEILIRNECENE